MTRSAKVRAEKETDPVELRRLIRWFGGIADDYKSARLGAVDDHDIGKMAELHKLEQEARKKAEDYRAQLRKAGYA